jgi:hypothetical protein
MKWKQKDPSGRKRAVMNGGISAFFNEQFLKMLQFFLTKKE